MNTRYAAAPSVRELVLDHPHLTSDELADLLPDATPSTLRRMRANGSLLGIRIPQRGYMYPCFQFDQERGRVLPLVVRVNRELHKTRSVESSLEWWFAAGGTPSRSPSQLTGDPVALLARIEV